MSKHEDFKLEARTLPLAQQALGLCFISKATVVQDLKQATDFVMLSVGSSSVAFRMRRPNTTQRWCGGPDVTIRLSRPTGAKTEWQKVIDEGSADFMFYAVLESESPDVLGRFVVLNLGKLRAQWRASFNSIPHEDRHVPGGQTLRALKTANLNPDCFVAGFRWPMTLEQARASRQVRPVGDWCAPYEPYDLLVPEELWMAKQGLMFG